MTKKRIDKHIFRLGIVIVSSLCMSCTIKNSPSESEIQKNPFYELINEFAGEFYYKNFGQYCVPDSDFLYRNYLFSPVSLMQAMCFIHDATNETLKTKLRDVLKINNADFDYKEEIKKIISDLDKKYEDEENNEYFFSKLSTALFLYNSIRDDLNYDVIDELVDTYSTNIYYCNPEDIDDYASDFIKESTDNNYTKHGFTMIKIIEDDGEPLVDGEIVYPDPITYSTMMFIKSSWGVEFKKNNKNIEFINASESISMPSYIECSSDLRVYEEKDVKAISIPLLCNHNFNILLPNENTDCLKVINRYYSKFFSLSFSKSYIANTTVLLPKMAFGYGTYKRNIFEVLPIEDECEQQQWLDGLSKGEGSYAPSNFSQYVKYEIDTDGLKELSENETRKVIQNKYDSSKRIDFVINRPYLFSITNEDNIPLLIGQCNRGRV